MWDPAQYLAFSDERDRPFMDLLARVPVADARAVVDLGCGDGHLTARLAERWPRAHVVGVDSSAEMLARARPLAMPGRLGFARGDVRDFRAARPVDVLFSNATLHWVADHAALLPALAAAVAPGGVLAFQIPGNFAAPSHRLLGAVAAQPPWAERLRGVAAEAHAREAALIAQDPAWYVERLAALGFTTDAWETTYLHVLPGEDAVLAWTKGTALRPFLAALQPSQADAFLAAYGARLRDAYPRRAHGTPFPFRRLFVVARRPS